MARPTRSQSLYTQIFGRGTRPLEGVVDFPGSTAELRRAAIAASAKPHFKVTDLVDASMEHKIVTSVDVLGGRYEMPVIERVKKEILESAGGPVDIEKALQDAEEALRREREEAERKRRAQVQARAEYAKVAVDPFDEYSRGSGTAKKKNKCHMPFGKHKGKSLSDIPSGYMEWALGNMKMAGWLYGGMKAELDSRAGRTPQPQTKQQRSLDEINLMLLEK
jgi:type I site-specific restriction endonuclease